MEHELAGQGLQSSGPAFDYFIINLRRTDGLDIQPVRGVADRRKLDRTVLRQSRDRVLLVPGCLAQRIEPPWR